MFPLIVGNWKMHKTGAETKQFIQKIKPLVGHLPGIWLAVAFTSLDVGVKEAAGSAIEIGAQNLSDVISGALTGEVSSVMVKEAGASFVILGHSERRRLFGENDAMINRKIKLAVKAGLKVVFCIGETKEEREKGETEAVLKRQIRMGLEDIEKQCASQIIFAYEPIWAIGTSNPATPEIVEEIHSLCKNYVANYWGLQENGCRILYGGSVNAENAGTFLSLPLVDGLLIGAASLDEQSFLEIIYQA